MRDYDIPEDLAIERETAVLLNGVFSPGNPENIKEAIYKWCQEQADSLAADRYNQGLIGNDWRDE